MKAMDEGHAYFFLSKHVDRQDSLFPYLVNRLHKAGRFSTNDSQVVVICKLVPDWRAAVLSSMRSKGSF